MLQPNRSLIQQEMASTHRTTEILASCSAFLSGQLQRGYFYLIKTQNGRKRDGNGWVSIPSRLHNQDVEQMEAQAVQSVGVGCRFDERQDCGDDGDHQDERGKCWPEKKKKKIRHKYDPDCYFVIMLLAVLVCVTFSNKRLMNWYGRDLSKINTSALRRVCRCFSGVH